MTHLERDILTTLAKAKERHSAPSFSLNNIWKVCGSPKVLEFAGAWQKLKAAGWLAGLIDTEFGLIRGLGRITTQGEQELKRLEAEERLNIGS
jgi:hypothetical protein